MLTWGIQSVSIGFCDDYLRKQLTIPNITIALKTTPEEQMKKKKELWNQWWRRKLLALLSGLKYIPTLST